MAIPLDVVRGTETGILKLLEFVGIIKVNRTLVQWDKGSNSKLDSSLFNPTDALAWTSRLNLVIRLPFKLCKVHLITLGERGCLLISSPELALRQSNN